MTTISALVSRGKEAPFTLETLELAEPGPDEVLVKISAAGLCHTDLAVLGGPMMMWPGVLGHEGAGVIDRVGTNVTEVKPGDHVATTVGWCGRCASCLQGRPTKCARMMPLNFTGTREDGSTILTASDGSPVGGRFLGQSCFATHALLSSTSVIPVPDDLDFTIVAALGCGLQTGSGAVLNTLRVSPGDSIVISGVGPVGLGAVMAARAAGATRIVAIDLLASRRELALEVGATHAVDGRGDNVLAQIQEAVGGPADFAFDSTGVPEVVLTDLAALKLDGHFAAGASGLGAASQSPVMLGKTIHNVVAGDSVPRLFLPRLIDLHRHGMFPVERLITTYPLADIDTAIEDTQVGKATKAILTTA
ncbi:NAD(P)-dependent alcohol dehydrogenase [Streptomyces blattellae]|uniref:NAD(P)-dependent alcohol dehydrogenase n=1 Tax=Streptomyces blattellae TaxID=2569855 RepID=UPI0012B7CF6F|nr:NAD(P)-dependent alcohol dehydrogenase [Streptomyces blattellae]